MHSDSQTVRVNLLERSYDIQIGSGCLPDLGRFARARASDGTALVVTDRNTGRYFASDALESLDAAGFSARAVSLPAGEATKSLDSARQIYDELIDMAASRETLVVPVGGGVVGDLAGFAAATYARGLPFLQVPTSLLAQVDSSVGGKVAVNYETADGAVIKNVIGAFHQPIGVFIDTATLDSLPDTELLSGMAEVVKYGVILDAAFFEYVERHAGEIQRRDPEVMRQIIGRSCALKAAVVEGDERETSGRRAILNYGHTFAHAIEALTKNYRHGEAVAMGMIRASCLAEKLGLVSKDVTLRQTELLGLLKLPTQFPALPKEQVLEVMMRDKKTRRGRLRFVLPRRIGEVELVDDVDESLVLSVI